MEEIIRIVSEITMISTDDIFSRKRTSDICEARQIFIYLSSAMLGKSSTSIAKFLGRTQPNISSQLLNFHQQLKIYKALSKKVEEIKNAVL